MSTGSFWSLCTAGVSRRLLLSSPKKENDEDEAFFFFFVFLILSYCLSSFLAAISARRILTFFAVSLSFVGLACKSRVLSILRKNALWNPDNSRGRIEGPRILTRILTFFAVNPDNSRGRRLPILTFSGVDPDVFRGRILTFFAVLITGVSDAPCVRSEFC
jgi:hypothetical protein